MRYDRSAIIIAIGIVCLWLILGLSLIARGDASFSGSFYNEHDTLSLSTSLDNGHWCMDACLLPDYMFCGPYRNINMHECGESTGDSSSSMTFTNYGLVYSWAFVSHDRDTKWKNDVINTWSNGIPKSDINTMIVSKAIV